MEKYINMALEEGMLHAKLISPDQMVFDIRTYLKCRWGCENYDGTCYHCQDRKTTYAERQEMIRAYHHILLLHNSDGHTLSRTALKIERQAFLDGWHLSFAIRSCNLCKTCAVRDGKECVTPLNVRPCEALFGVDVYETAKRHDLPCYPLKDKNETQNRYAFVCLS